MNDQRLLRMFNAALSAYREKGHEGLKTFLQSIKTNYGVTSIAQMTPEQKQDFICELLLEHPPFQVSDNFEFVTVEQIKDDQLKTAVRNLMTGFKMPENNKLIYFKD